MGIEPPLDQDMRDFIKLESLTYPIVELSASDGDPEATFPESTYAEVWGEKTRYGVPSMMVLKDCKKVWSGVGFGAQKFPEWMESNVDKYLWKTPSTPEKASPTLTSEKANFSGKASSSEGKLSHRQSGSCPIDRVDEWIQNPADPSD